MNDFLDNLGADLWQKMHKPKKLNGVKITPQTYIDMNESFKEEGLAITISIPTQEQIDKWQEWSDNTPYIEMPPSRDLVQEMLDKHNRIEEERKLQLELDL